MLPPASDQEEAVHARVGGRTGFTDDLMRSGVGAFVGCCGSPTDMGAAEFAVRVYDALLDGATIAHAVRDARRETAAQLPDDATPLLFTLSGFGSLRLTGNRT